ncbi:MAG: MBOAT family O-acyltransferase [Leptospirales bacterium]|jgi:alginate O-acetyltransferase complex protein AlgI
MRFTSLIFLAFFLCVYILFWSGRRTRLPLLFVASFAFYAAWSIGFALHFMAVIVVSYSLIRIGHQRRRTLYGESSAIYEGRKDDRDGPGGGEGGGRPYWLWSVLGLNFANLFLFKYAGAAALLFADLGLWRPGGGDAAAALSAAWPGFALVLPLAISFYTFQICAYAIDVSRGQIPEDPGFLRFAVFILFFPQLVAGPIMRYSEFFGQLERLDRLEPRLPQMSAGVYLLIQGFAKKVLIADNLSPATFAVLFAPEQYDWQSNVAAVVGFAAQLYCDFSGYTDIARGLGKLLGLELPENFFAPYLSSSFRVFWRNWHRTLTTWLRDYVYIPLGGSRLSGWRAALNTLIVLLLIGVWHGAGYNFFVLGLINGLYLIGEGLVVGWLARFPRLVGSPIAPALGVVITLSFVCVAMVMMVTPDFATTLDVYRRVFGLDPARGAGSGGERFAGVSQLWGGFALALFFNALQRLREFLTERAGRGDAADWFFETRARSYLSLGGLWLLGFLFLVLIGRFAPGSADFIYFQF